MAEAKHGDTVRIHYTGKLDDGTVVDTSIGAEPWQFTLGKDRFVADLEQAVIGMNPGESKTITIAAHEVGGPRQEELVITADRNRFSENFKPEVGQDLRIREADSQSLSVTVTEVSESSVTLDANHPLAGKDLTLGICLMEIV
jgi:peptidylprolyl isomerase